MKGNWYNLSEVIMRQMDFSESAIKKMKNNQIIVYISLTSIDYVSILTR